MFNFVSNLQDKPESYRKKFALFFSITFILIVITFWLVFVMSKADTIVSLNEEERVIKVEDVSSPIESLVDSLGSAMSSLRGLFEGSVEHL